MIPVIPYFLISSAAPVTQQQSTLAASFSTLKKPYLVPYYVYFGNPKTPKLVDAKKQLGLQSVVIGFASADKGKVRTIIFKKAYALLTLLQLIQV